MISDFVLASLGFLVLNQSDCNSLISKIIYLGFPLILFVAPMILMKRLNEHLTMTTAKKLQKTQSGQQNTDLLNNRQNKIPYIDWSKI